MITITSINHVGIIVKDIEESLLLYKEYFTIQKVNTKVIEKDNIKIAYLSFENMDLELIQPCTTYGKYYDFLRNGGGLHHISIEIENITSTLNKLNKNEVNLTSSQPKLGGKGSLVLFSEKESFEGVIIEFKQKD